MDTETNPPDSALEALLDIMRRLRDPDTGCPWDVAQTFETIAPYTLEEAYEVADAIEQDDMTALKDELGDLLFQVVFHTQMAAELGAFDFADVAAGVSEKMHRRHPHVFGDASIADANAQTQAWEQHKADERAIAAEVSGRSASVLDGVARGLPALSRAIKLQNRAARIGFDWPEARQILDKVEEEVAELKAELMALEKNGTSTRQQARIESELGDVLLAWSNFARHTNVDPEAALRGANQRFENRFRRVESLMAETGRDQGTFTLDEMEILWGQAKAELNDS
jgi:nucleoside triphosphate diphosphatase